MLVVSACIVSYKSDNCMFFKAIESFIWTKLPIKLFIIDNSPTSSLKNKINSKFTEYIHNPSNPGFGAGHNIAIKKIYNESKYHLILNPDIYFNEGVIEELVNYLDNNADVGIVMPKVLYPDNMLQPIAKLLPSPFDFIVRRFIPIKSIRNLFNKDFELRYYHYDKPLEVPFLSGCFMLCRTDVLTAIKGFDENIFMYTEDIDLCRRVINAGHKTVVYPKVSVYHAHEHKSFSSFNTFKVYLKSAIYYFNKWGWFLDKNRNIINRKTLAQIKSM